MYELMRCLRSVCYVSCCLRNYRNLLMQILSSEFECQSDSDGSPTINTEKCFGLYSMVRIWVETPVILSIYVSSILPGGFRSSK
jgi:hypothetical protein